MEERVAPLPFGNVLEGAISLDIPLWQSLK